MPSSCWQACNRPLQHAHSMRTTVINRCAWSTATAGFGHTVSVGAFQANSPRCVQTQPSATGASRLLLLVAGGQRTDGQLPQWVERRLLVSLGVQRLQGLLSS